MAAALLPPPPEKATVGADVYPVPHTIIGIATACFMDPAVLKVIVGTDVYLLPTFVMVIPTNLPFSITAVPVAVVPPDAGAEKVTVGILVYP